MTRHYHTHPDGYFHGRLTIFATPAAAALGMIVTGDVGGVVAGALGCLLGLFIDPDLDQEMVTSSEWRVIKLPVVGKLLGSAWVGLWMPYALMMPHRGLSHMPILGTLTRVGYLSLIFEVVFFVATGHLWFVGQDQLPFVFAALLGLMTSDILHWARDWFGLQL